MVTGAPHPGPYTDCYIGGGSGGVAILMASLTDSTGHTVSGLSASVPQSGTIMCGPQGASLQLADTWPNSDMDAETFNPPGSSNFSTNLPATPCTATTSSYTALSTDNPSGHWTGTIDATVFTLDSQTSMPIDTTMVHISASF
jgi:hypothetical protein